jgi:hypothetical protein
VLRSTNTPGPFIIAAPLATVPNWISEFKVSKTLPKTRPAFLLDFQPYNLGTSLPC